MRAQHAGMTLVELLVVVTIIAMLTSIAVPGYRNYVIRANRTEAKVELLSIAAALERCFTRYNQYNHANCAAAQGFPKPSADGRYTIEFDTVGPVTGIAAGVFYLRAVPQGPQAQDQKCGTFRINDANEKTVSTSTPTRDCWGK